MAKKTLDGFPFFPKRNCENTNRAKETCKMVYIGTRSFGKPFIGAKASRGEGERERERESGASVIVWR